MKKFILFTFTTAFLFGLSAAGSYYWQKQQLPVSAENTDKSGAENGGKKSGPAHHAAPEHAEEPPRAALRPPLNPAAEEAARLTGEVRARLAAVRDKEEQLAARKKQLDLIGQDLRGERAALDDLRKQIKSELEALNEALNGLEKQRTGLDDERQKVTNAVHKMESRVLEIKKDENDNLKKMSTMYGAMAPEAAARILQNLADTGKMDTAVKMLGFMQERQAAKVLAELNDTSLAAQLLEKLKSLHRGPPVSLAPPVTPQQ